MISNNNILVKSATDLKLLKETLTNATVIAIDTEFTWKTTYFAQLSLLQLATSSNIAFIIDYLEDPSIIVTALELIYSSKAVKVLHAAKNDLEILHNLTGKLPSNIFDTQIAFMALSPLNNVSYATLIKTILKKELNKSETLSNWQQRPLTAKQLNYAALDVIMLYQAYFVLYKELIKQNRLEFITEKLSALSDYSNYNFNLEKVVERYLTNYNITSSHAVLAAVLNWRETTAKEHNIPRQHILSDSNIKELVNNPKAPLKLLHKNKFMSLLDWQQIIRLAQDKFVQFDNSFSTKNNYPKHNLLDISYELLKFISSSSNVNKELICNKIELNQFLHNFATIEKPLTAKTNLSQTLFVPWRYNIFTKKLQLFLSGKLCLTINNGKMVFK